MSNDTTILTLNDALDFKNGRPLEVRSTGKYPIYGSNGIIGRCDQSKWKNAIIIGRVGAYCGSINISRNPFWATDNTIVATVKQKEFDIRYFYYATGHWSSTYLVCKCRPAGIQQADMAVHSAAAPGS